MSAPEICVALSVRDGGPYLGESIESVLAQTGASFELRVYDNGSTDGSQDVVRGYAHDGRVTLTQNPSGMWFPGSMNRAAQETAAQLLVPWASDDRMLPGNLARKADALRATGAEIAFGQVVNIDSAGRRTGVSAPVGGTQRRAFRPLEWLFLTAPLNSVMLPSVMVRTAALRRVGGFDQRLVLACDWRLWLALAMRVPAVWEPGELVEYREHGENHSAGAWRDGSWAVDLPAAMADALADGALPPLPGAQRDEILLAVYRYLAGQLAGRGHLRHATSAYPAYAVLGEATRRMPRSGAAREAFAAAVRAAALRVPDGAGRVVIAPAFTPPDVGAALDAARAAVDAGLAASVVALAPAAEVERASALLGDALAAGPEVDVDLVPDGTFADAAAACGLALVAFGSPLALLAEAAGVPALVWGAPDPLAAPRDPARYDCIAADAGADV